MFVVIGLRWMLKIQSTQTSLPKRPPHLSEIHSDPQILKTYHRQGMDSYNPRSGKVDLVDGICSKTREPRKERLKSGGHFIL